MDLQCCVIEACRDGIWWYNKVVNDVTFIHLQRMRTCLKLNGLCYVVCVCVFFFFFFWFEDYGELWKLGRELGHNTFFFWKLH
jgi:hypothetical protein